MKSNSAEVELWTTKQAVLATLFVVCVFLSFWFLYRFRVAAFLFFIAVVIGTTMRPVVEWLYHRGISRRVGIIIIYALIAALLAGFLALAVPLIVDQTTQFSQFLPEYQLNFRRALVNSNNLLLRNIGLRIPARFNFLNNSNLTAEEVLNQVNQTFRYASLLIKGVLNILAVFLLAYYWTQESNFVIRNFLRLVPSSRRNDIREFIKAMEEKIGGYVRGQGTLSVVVGVAAFISYAIIGLPYTLVLAIIAGILEMVPIFGPVLGAIPAFLVALSIDPGKAVWVLVAATLIQLAENTFLVPRIMNDSMGVNPILILLSLVTFSSVFGFAGALLALPLAAVIQLIIERIVSSANGTRRSIDPREADIRALLERSHATAQAIHAMPFDGNSSLQVVPEPVRKELTSISTELNELLSRLRNKEEKEE